MKNRVTMWSSNPTPSIYLEKTNLKRYRNPNVHRSSIHNSQYREQSKCPLTGRWIKKMWYICNGMALSHKREWNMPFDICSNTDGLRDDQAKCSNQEEKDKYHASLPCGTTVWHKWVYLWNRLTDTKNRLVVAKGERGGGERFTIYMCVYIYIYTHTYT